MRKSGLVKATRQLCAAVSGVDWDAEQVQECVTRIHELVADAARADLDGALRVIVERLERASVDDADGVAHAALTGGTLVERGARPRPLGEALVARLPSVLAAARRFADTCVEPIKDSEDPWAGVVPKTVLAEVDGLPITLATLRRHVSADRPGASALALLTEWTLPTVAALTRDRALLQKATEEPAIVAAATRLRRSEASWLHLLFATQLDATWRIVILEQRRAFELRVDGVSSNFDLHELVERALHGAGVPTKGRSAGSVAATFELLTPGALPFIGRKIPAEHVVWREGVPTDVPAVDGVRTLIAVAPTIARTWSASSPFAALTPHVEVERELPAAEARAFLRALATARG